MKLLMHNWKSNYNKISRARYWERQEEDYEMLVTPDQVSQYLKSSSSEELAIKLFEIFELNSRSVTQTEYWSMHDHLFVLIHFSNGHPNIIQESHLSGLFLLRPVNSGAKEIFDKLCYWLENECEMEVLTLVEVHDKMKSMSDEHEPYSKKRLKTKLQQRFGDHLVFSEVCGKKNVFSFKNMVNYIINKKWYEEINNDVEQEAMRIITTAAKLIRQEIQDIDIDTVYYPTTQGIKESTQQNQWCSPLFRMFLSKVVPNEIKQASIGQCIIKAARPRTAIPPLLFGILESS